MASCMPVRILLSSSGPIMQGRSKWATQGELRKAYPQIKGGGEGKLADLTHWVRGQGSHTFSKSLKGDNTMRKFLSLMVLAALTGCSTVGTVGLITKSSSDPA